MFPTIFAAIMTIITWSGMHAAPTLFKQKQLDKQQQIDLAKDLCQNHNDCEAQKAIAMKGIKVKK